MNGQRRTGPTAVRRDARNQAWLTASQRFSPTSRPPVLRLRCDRTRPPHPSAHAPDDGDRVETGNKEPAAFTRPAGRAMCPQW